MEGWQLTVGLEIHIELETQTKMFCGCPNDPFGSVPNTNVCPVCFGLPGALPVINKEAVMMVIKLGQALKSKIATETFWARKNYFYPDLPKGYQISQSTLPLVRGGALVIDGQSYRLNHAHLEEDAGKLSHSADAQHSLVDYNRAGVPLLELVTEPDFHSTEAAKRFCQELQRIVRMLEISSADMEKGRMRCEANISVAKPGESLGNKVEVKNINSFRSVEKAIQYEYDRQVALLEKGEKVDQETRTWNDAQGKTVLMRRKETSADYRYFPEPDLPAVKITTELGDMVLLPDEQRQKLLGLSIAKEAAEIIVDRHVAGKFYSLGEQAAEFAKIYIANPKVLELKEDQYSQLSVLRKEKGLTKEQTAQLIATALTSDKDLSAIAQEMTSSEVDLSSLTQNVISQFPAAVADYQAGKEVSFNFLVGQVMAKAKGKANINAVREELEKSLSS